MLDLSAVVAHKSLKAYLTHQCPPSSSLSFNFEVEFSVWPLVGSRYASYVASAMTVALTVQRY